MQVCYLVINCMTMKSWQYLMAGSNLIACHCATGSFINSGINVHSSLYCLSIPHPDKQCTIVILVWRPILEFSYQLHLKVQKWHPIFTCFWPQATCLGQVPGSNIVQSHVTAIVKKISTEQTILTLLNPVFLDKGFYTFAAYFQMLQATSY